MQDQQVMTVIKVKKCGERYYINLPKEFIDANRIDKDDTLAGLFTSDSRSITLKKGVNIRPWY